MKRADDNVASPSRAFQLTTDSSYEVNFKNKSCQWKYTLTEKGPLKKKEFNKCISSPLLECQPIQMNKKLISFTRFRLRDIIVSQIRSLFLVKTLYRSYIFSVCCYVRYKTCYALKKCFLIQRANFRASHGGIYNIRKQIWDIVHLLLSSFLRQT